MSYIYIYMCIYIYILYWCLPFGYLPIGYSPMGYSVLAISMFKTRSATPLASLLPPMPQTCTTRLVTQNTAEA